MKRTLLAAGLMLMPLTVHAQSNLTCDPNCHFANPTSAASQSQSTASSRATATTNSRSQSTANSGVATGNTINAPVTTTSRATGGAGGSSNVVVVNRVSGGGGGYRGRSGTAAGDPSGGTQAASDPPAATDPAAQLGSPGLPLTENIGGNTTQTLRNTPEIVAPNISGGNPCLVGVSGGGAGPGIGITLGFGYSDRGCDRRNNAALLSNIGLRDAAMELMCQDDSVRRALSQSGHPCAEDRPVAAAAPAPVASVDPAVIRREQEAVAPVPAPVPPPVTIVPTAVAGAVKPAWCDTTGPTEMKFHPECR